MDVLGNLKKVLSFAFRAGAWTITFKGDTVTPPTKDITINIPDGDASQSLVTDSSTNTLTNKTIDSAGTGNILTFDADEVNTTITNIDNDEIKAGAAIDAAKIHDASVSNTEFGYLNGVTSAIQTQLNTGATNLSDHEGETTGAHAGSAIANTPSGNLAATDMQGAVDELQTELDTATAHISDPTDAHAGSAITNTPSGNLIATTMQGAVDELQTELDTATAHISDPTDAHAGSAITNTPSGNLAATDMQGAVNEIQTELDAATTHVAVVTGNPHVVTATELASGTLADARLSANVDLLDTAQTLTGEKTHEKVVLADGTAIDANASSTLAEPDKTVIKLTGTPSVTDIVTITATSTTTGKVIQLQNDTASAFIIKESGNIVTGTSGEIEFATEAVLILRYDGTNWRVVGGSGGGAGGLELVEVSTTLALASISTHYLVDTSAAAFTITLPDASSLSAANKKVATIKFSDSSESWTDKNLTIAPASGETIDGFAVDETFVLDVSGSTVEMSWDDVNAHWALDLGGAGAGGGGGLTIEEYAYGSLPATLVKDVHYLVDFGGGSSLTASATMPAVGSEAGAIKVSPVNDGGGCKITLTRAGSDQFNDPDLGLDTTYDVDVGSATFNTNVNDATYEITDAYWAAATDAGQTKYAINPLGTSLTGSDSDNADLRFINLTIGKQYKVTISGLFIVPSSSGTDFGRIQAFNNGVVVGSITSSMNDTSAIDIEVGTSKIFTAAATTLAFNCTVSGTATISNSGSRTYTMLEELPQHAITTDWDQSTTRSATTLR